MKIRHPFPAIIAGAVLGGLGGLVAAVSAQTGKDNPPARQLVGLTNDSIFDRVLYRAWSDGVVEARSLSTPPAWNGWQRIDQPN